MSERRFIRQLFAVVFATALNLVAAFAETPNVDGIVSCQAAPSYREPGEMAAAYARSAYEIEYRTSDVWGAGCKGKRTGGVAFLIDPAGYFLTASHNFRHTGKRVLIDLEDESKGARPVEVQEDGYRVVKHQCPIYLRRGSLKIEVKEIACGNPGDCPLSSVREQIEQLGAPAPFLCSEDADYSILQALPTAGASGAADFSRFIGAPIPDIYMGQPAAEGFASALAILGYPADERLRLAAGDGGESPWIATHKPDWLVPLTDQYQTSWTRRDQFLVTRGSSTEGLSGAAALDRFGRIWGINKGPERSRPPYKEEYDDNGALKKCDPANFESGETGNQLVTRTYNLGRGLRKIPLIGEAKILQDELERGEVSETAKSFARRGQATHFEAYRLIAAILDERGAALKAQAEYPNNKYKKGLSEAGLEMLNLARCADLSFEMAELAAEMQRLGVFDERPWDDSDRVSAVILASAVYDDVAIQSAQTRDSARDLFQRALANVSIERIDEDHAVTIGGGYARYALLLMNAGSPEETAPNSDLAGRAVSAALRLAPFEWRSSFAAAKHLEASGRRGDSRTMGLVSLALAEEAETSALMAHNAEAAADARRARENIRAQTPSLDGVSDKNIAALSRRIADRYRAHSFEPLLRAALPTLEVDEPVF